jgi:hypothetical protein
MSVTQPQLGAGTVNRRSSRFCLMGRPCPESVVQRKRRSARARSPAMRISRATRLRPVRWPRSRNSTWTRGLP